MFIELTVVQQDGTYDKQYINMDKVFTVTYGMFNNESVTLLGGDTLDRSLPVKESISDVMALVLGKPEDDNKNGYFKITSVHRDDLESKGFNTENVTDSTMFRLAEKMSNAYTNETFWIDLEIVAEAMGIPKIEKLDDDE